MSGTSSRPAALPFQVRFFRLLFGKLAQASIWLFAGSAVAGMLGYVFQVLMGRMLSPADYGLFTAMMAMFAIVAAPLGTLMMVVARKVSEYRAHHDSASISDFYSYVHFRAAALGCAFALIAFALSSYAQDYLKAGRLAPVYALWALLFFSALPIINNAFLQGLQKFQWLSASTSLSLVLKIVLAACLVALGYGVTGALIGSALAAIATWILTYAPLRATLRAARKATRNSNSALKHLALKPVAPVLIANAAFAAMTQLDMVLVNHYFSPREAGCYAAASVLGKAVMYLPGGIALALFPMVAEGHARNERTVGLLMQAVALTVVVCACGALFYLLFGEPLIILLYGEGYRGAAATLQYFGFAMLPMALVTVAEYFLIARGRVLFAYLFFIAAPLQVLAVHYWHDSLLTVVAVVGMSGVVLAIIGYAALWWSFSSQGMGQHRGGPSTGD